MERRVKGMLFVDYVRMLRAKKGTDWSRYLTPVDLVYLNGRVTLTDWYPMETFERMGVAILAEVADGNPMLARMWGRLSVDTLALTYANLVVPGDPRESLMRFQVLRRGFFDYPAVEVDEVSDHHASIRVSYGMGLVAEEAASEQTLGFFERLLEVAGAVDCKAAFASRSWAGDAATIITLRWTRGG